jgi:hypothetical protein
LVVTAARGVQLLAGLADARGELRFDIHVHVFKRLLPNETPGFDIRANGG